MARARPLPRPMYTTQWIHYFLTRPPGRGAAQPQAWLLRRRKKEKEPSVRTRLVGSRGGLGAVSRVLATQALASVRRLRRRRSSPRSDAKTADWRLNALDRVCHCGTLSLACSRPFLLCDATKRTAKRPTGESTFSRAATRSLVLFFRANCVGVPACSVRAGTRPRRGDRGGRPPGARVLHDHGRHPSCRPGSAAPGRAGFGRKRTNPGLP